MPPVTKRIILLTSLLISPMLAAEVFPVPTAVVSKAMGPRVGVFVMIDCASKQVSNSDATASGEALAPCSTFKIWNTLIGLECSLIKAPDEAFYQWDEVKRGIAGWNRNLTLKEAFQASCVPAFQDLARRIGTDRMNRWLQKFDYGNKDSSAGIDCFWLPAEDRKTILISPLEQTRLLCRFANQKLPVSPGSTAVMKKVMQIRSTDRGILYGKTGSRSSGPGKYNMGWFVGFVESGGRTYAFACNIQAPETKGSDAQSVTEMILKKQGLL